ncbi:hypothetical protein CAEBREN_02893 [Caenorhabditis brenneri]|uniref:Uncharacterized protein n=1 Tax=Caenorhabditis brenneri TaxID=135651 RepID=G0PKD6_CAEBE|nr:hypothetical protein CAEBREN_02893 [Caenorhabditis brenneri]
MLIEIFSIWLTLLTIGFTAMPTLMVLDWKKRGTADGFSSVTLVLPMMVQTFWLRYASMTDNQIFVIINVISLSFYSFYVSAFAYYQPKRQNLIGQILAVVTVIKLVFVYVDTFDKGSINEAMGTMAAGAQIFNLFGGVYEIISNMAALLVNVITLSLYFFYPPLTWTVPIFNIPPQQKTGEDGTDKKKY